MVTVLLLHKVQVGVIEQLLRGETAVVEGNTRQEQLVALTENKFAEHHQLPAREVDVAEHDVRRGVRQAGQLKAREQASRQLTRARHALRVHVDVLLAHLRVALTLLRLARGQQQLFRPLCSEVDARVAHAPTALTGTIAASRS